MNYEDARRIAETATSEQRNAFAIVAGQHVKSFLVMAFTRGYEVGAAGEPLDVDRLFAALELEIDIPEW